MIPLLIILISIVSATYGNIVDVEHTEDFFDPVGEHLRTEPNNQFIFDIVPTIPNPDRKQFIFRFRVKSGGETHVALTDQYKGETLMYDIVFGKNKNRYAAVSQCSFQNCKELAAVLMPDAVNADIIQDLWIGYNFDQGMVALGRGVDSVPALEARTTEPFVPSELGFSTFGGTVGYWWFPQKHLVMGGCGSLLYKASKSYSYQYRLPVVPYSSATNLELEFSANALRDVRILLAPEVGLTDQEPAYEIIIGSDLNRESEIRRCNGAVECCPTIATAQTMDILDDTGITFRTFHILYNNGVIKVFREEEDIPFLTARDPYPISVRAIAYSQGPFSKGWVKFPAQGITLGLLVYDTEADGPFNMNLPLVPQSKAKNLELTFQVKAERSVLMAFSPEVDINNYNGALYEIIIGWENNKKTDIRLCKGCDSRKGVYHAPLDPNEFRQFRISINNGRIDLYEGARADPSFFFYNTQHLDPLSIKTVGFATSDGATGRFLFDTCNLYG